MRKKDIKLYLLCVVVASFGLMLGCNLNQLPGINLDHNHDDELNASAHCFDIARLTETGFLETEPKVVIDKNGRVGVFWSFRGTITPLVIGRYLVEEEGRWTGPERVASFVGSWDVAPSPDPGGGFLLIRSDWGNILVSDLRNGKGQGMDTHFRGYVVWTSFSKGGEGYGRIIGRKRPLEGDWEEIEELYQEPIFGRAPSIAADLGKVWLSWEEEGEIYALRLRSQG